MDNDELLANAKLTSKGQITIPKIVRDKLKLKEGDIVIFHLEGKDVKMTNRKDCKIKTDNNKQQAIIKRGKKNEWYN